MAKTTLHTLLEQKRSGEKFTCLTSYDATHAHLVSTQGTEIILVGDSLGNVVQGRESTVPVTMADMVYHTNCVRRGNTEAMIMSDIPFMACSTPEQTYANATELMQAGAEVIKLEGGAWLCDTVRGLSERGIPTCLHLGLTPQSVSMLGGYKVQGRDEESAARMLEDARLLEEAGANILLLECVPSPLAQEITRNASIPVIGIGAGAETDGQVLVLYDMLGMTHGRKPRFVKDFMAEASTPAEAIATFVKDVKEGRFPAPEHGFSA
ncbi:3-methyl-2-oxobutanoate hydroxymethyltransferase [Sansalvadorimonas sp. 2012CJ34-2]|uniref:3-methyl-2-oxobutanoate hydroxymethyltransferase n=1 Tax=Parendozoicomonas callyspongiae TaxID=2942213 RepID=A0ABT0PKH6_9GAMM|nr:3-methyl-2-oxobutanoate hydroxymethyltransferase [Sansalvadorimonas sp. 2012CJ34-2]MCL6271776.1 3-methyl-2-oxobutanoate hydroxymethyltransferase [Sansalvadorimonas sp. 2012CJ34-2]